MERSRRTVHQVPDPLSQGRGIADRDEPVPVTSQSGQGKQSLMVDERRRREVDDQLTRAGDGVEEPVKLLGAEGVAFTDDGQGAVVPEYPEWRGRSQSTSTGCSAARSARADGRRRCWSKAQRPVTRCWRMNASAVCSHSSQRRNASGSGARAELSAATRMPSNPPPPLLDGGGKSSQLVVDRKLADLPVDVLGVGYAQCSPRLELGHVAQPDEVRRVRVVDDVEQPLAELEPVPQEGHDGGEEALVPVEGPSDVIVDLEPSEAVAFGVATHRHPSRVRLFSFVRREICRPSMR